MAVDFDFPVAPFPGVFFVDVNSMIDVYLFDVGTFPRGIGFDAAGDEFFGGEASMLRGGIKLAADVHVNLISDEEVVGFELCEDFTNEGRIVVAAHGGLLFVDVERMISERVSPQGSEMLADWCV